MRRPDVYSEDSAMDCNNQLVLSLEQLEEPHLAMCSGTAGEMEQVVSEDLDHGALIFRLGMVGGAIEVSRAPMHRQPRDPPTTSHPQPLLPPSSRSLQRSEGTST